MRTSRRRFLRTTTALAAGGLLGKPARVAAGEKQVRRYHLSISEDALEADADLLDVVRRAGVTDVWVTGFLYGHWYYSADRIETWRRRVADAGMAAHIIRCVTTRRHCYALADES